MVLNINAKLSQCKVKLEATQRLDKGESVKRICDELGVGKSTVNDWRRSRFKWGKCGLG